ncbi:hypothetical protein MRX96_009418 [Rhipicephalus microplus]
MILRLVPVADILGLPWPLDCMELSNFFGSGQGLACGTLSGGFILDSGFVSSLAGSVLSVCIIVDLALPLALTLDFTGCSPGACVDDVEPFFSASLAPGLALPVASV